MTNKTKALHHAILVENVFGKRFNFLLRCSPLQEWYSLKEKKKKEKKKKDLKIKRTEEKKWEK